MLSIKVIEFCKQRGFWFVDEAANYAAAIKELGIQLNSDIAQFFLHAEDGPCFKGKGGEILHLGWHALNTNYSANTSQTLTSLNLKSDLLLLSSMEAGGGYFYSKAHMKSPTSQAEAH